MNLPAMRKMTTVDLRTTLAGLPPDSLDATQIRVELTRREARMPKVNR